MLAACESVRGLWTKDGDYMDLSNTESSGSGIYITKNLLYPLDPPQ